MRKLREKLDEKLLKAKLRALDFLHSERGDTNFISIAIILVVVLVLAVVFIKFGKDLVTPLKNAIKDVTDALGGGSGAGGAVHFLNF